MNQETETTASPTEVDPRLVAPKNDLAALLLFAAVPVLAAVLVPRLGFAQDTFAVEETTMPVVWAGPGADPAVTNVASTYEAATGHRVPPHTEQVSRR